MLSIIIPTLNEEKYVGKLLDCLVKQSYQDFEVIVVDGKSKDNTKNIVKYYKNRLNDLQFIQTTKGVSHQRNVGASHAKSKKLLFFDADITINNTFLEGSLKEIKRRKLRLASSGIKPDQKQWYYVIFFVVMNCIMNITQFFNKGGFGALLFIDKKLFDEVGGFDESLHSVVDHDLIKRASKYSRFGFLRTRFIHSVRRFELYGTKKTMWKWGKQTVCFLTKDAKTVNKKLGNKYGNY